MSVRVTFHCDGCDAKYDEPRTIRRPLGARISPLYVKKLPWNVEEAAPTDWIIDDPYTGCCYCQECWDSIEKGLDQGVIGGRCTL